MRHRLILLLAMLTSGGAACAIAAEPSTKTTRAPPSAAATGDVGPFRRATVTAAPAPDAPDGTLTVELRAADGVRLALPSPDEPADFFLLYPAAVFLAAVDRSGRDGVVVLYFNNRISRGRGADRRALVYRVEAARAVPLPALEARLEDVRTAAAARARLARVVR